MSTPTWEESVSKARAALRRTFDGRMDVAAASFEQFPPHGKGVPRGRTLADFAEEVGVEYTSLDEYRRVYTWLGDFLHVQEVSSYSLAREAMVRRRWETGRDFATFLAETEPPEGHRRWTVDALRVHVGKKPTNTGKVIEEAKTEGREPTEDELAAAEASDHFEAGAETASEIKDTKESRKTKQAAEEAEEAVEKHHHENVLRDLTSDGTEDEDLRRLREELARDARSHLAGDIAHHFAEGRRLLSLVQEFRIKFGDLRRFEDGPTLGEQMDETLREEAEQTAMAFESAMQRVGDEAETWLAGRTQ